MVSSGWTLYIPLFYPFSEHVSHILYICVLHTCYIAGSQEFLEIMLTVGHRFLANLPASMPSSQQSLFQASGSPHTFLMISWALWYLVYVSLTLVFGIHSPHGWSVPSFPPVTLRTLSYSFGIVSFQSLPPLQCYTSLMSRIILYHLFLYSIVNMFIFWKYMYI